MKNGTDAQKQFFLPKILRGEIHFCIGYSEPQAGTDLASLTTRADLDGDHWVVNGQKMWTSLAGDADYCWLAVRTDQQAPKHGGLSILIVDMKNTPGIRIDPLAPAGGARHQRRVLRRRAGSRRRTSSARSTRAGS